MVDAVKALPQEIKNIIELRLWNVLEAEGMRLKMALNAVRMPTMAMNNRLFFESYIPVEEELIEAIQECFTETPGDC